MAISMKRYVDITSGVGAGVRVPGRELIGRIFTPNPKLPADTILELEEAKDVAAFFGSDSEEYRRGAAYFDFISKTQTRPRKISFERFMTEEAFATLRAVAPLPDLEDLQEITKGSFSLTMNGKTGIILDRDFSEAQSYADIAGIIESGIRAVDSAPEWTGATVTYEPELGTFNFQAGRIGACPIAPAEETDMGTPIAQLIGWTAESGVLASSGHSAMTVTDTLNRSTEQSNNFGSFLFMSELTISQMKEAASFASLSNMDFIYCQRVCVDDYAEVREALKGYSGVALTEYLPDEPDEFHEMAPMILFAATDYTRRNGTINYMFHQFNLTPTVTDNAKADLLDAARINYYGRTQQAGQTIDFYQRGVLQGDVQDMNIYANEAWLKDRAGADIMTLKLALPKISANAEGRALVMGCLRNVIDMALKNGTISINKPLNYTQKAFITGITGDDTAWVQVQSQGYWLDVNVEEYTRDDRVEYKIVYLLIYAKDDVIRKTEGTHSLI